MSTEAQINANRQNSRKSTGPRSAEGKAAVSKNAVKHGLFALETVVKGENREDFEVYHDEILNEITPVGPVESMLAERFISLSWRLKRVERMQNQAIDVMIAKDEQPSPLAKLTQSMLPKNLRQSPANASASNGELVLGRVAIKDYSNSRVLDRLMMYERRIENSMFKTLNELERLRLLRELKQADADEEQFDPEPCPPAEKEVDLKFIPKGKQSQFINVQRSALSGLRQDEEKKFEKTKPIYSLCVLRDAYCERNLKKQSQF